MLNVQIITPEKVLFSDQADMVVVPGTEGDFGVLPGHAPFISTVRPGVITVESGNVTRKIAVAGGIAEAVPDRCTVLAEGAEECTDMSAADVESRLSAAKAAVEVAETDDERKAAARKLALAEALSLAIAA